MQETKRPRILRGLLLSAGDGRRARVHHVHDDRGGLHGRDGDDDDHGVSSRGGRDGSTAVVRNTPGSCDTPAQAAHNKQAAD